MKHNKNKIINDPVHGFITIPSEVHFDIIQHPVFQRLGRIRQLGLSYMVYPGAQHTRFQHSLGAMHLMGLAISQLRSRGNEITEAEAEAVLSAILLHDVGHSPFSHVLENKLTSVSHEDISLNMMNLVNREIDGRLDLAIEIFTNKYHKKFLHQLVSSQLDVDRLDYLMRDCFFSGVVEGAVGTSRIINMLNVVDDHLVVEQKGVNSIEKFLIARRMMYWQVYLHKTSIGAERMMINIISRAKHLLAEGADLFVPPSLLFFLKREITKDDFIDDDRVLKNYILLDDSDVMCAIKEWSMAEDKVLSILSKALINHDLFKTEVRDEPVTAAEVREKIAQLQSAFDLSAEETKYLMSEYVASANTYTPKGDENKIKILSPSGNLKDISEISDIINITNSSNKVQKYFFCYLRI